MITRFKFPLLLLSLLTVVLSSIPGEATGANPLMPAPQKSCGAGLSIVSVTYKGKVQGDDHVEVVLMPRSIRRVPVWVPVWSRTTLAGMY